MNKSRRGEGGQTTRTTWEGATSIRHTINLMTAHLPMHVPTSRMRYSAGGTEGFSNLHYYQLVTVEQERQLFHLRLGDFASVQECDAIIAVLRERYPNAQRVRAEAADRQAMATAVSRHSAVRQLREQPTLDRPIDSTRTVRKLSLAELNNSALTPWYAVELLESGREVNAEDVPALDIFDVYSLYMVPSHHERRAQYSLRLGFYSGTMAAEAVAQYLRGYFENAKVMRVSAEEYARFNEWTVRALKVVSDTGRHEIIEMSAAHLG